MMHIIPTYKVVFNYYGDGSTPLEFRVSETVLESFLSVLLFNGVSEFSVKREGNNE